MKCINCKKEKELLSKALGICLECIRNDFENISSHIEAVHRSVREQTGYPGVPPRSKSGISCRICANDCVIPPDQKGYCGLRLNKDGRIKNIGGTKDLGIFEWYFDPLPTNCVADWVCDGSKARGYKNLAVFYCACSFNCLFCQNWHFRHMPLKGPVSAEELASYIDDRTFCICYFGGDPSVQIIHALETSKLALRLGVRVCFETNGSMRSDILQEVAEIVLESKGCIKFDLKTFDERLNIALCGVSNRKTYQNFEYLAKLGKERKAYPFLVASTLLVPGYIDVKEVKRIATFIAELDPNIPYTLLAFYPHFYMRDLPTTSWKLAFECKEAAEGAGLKKIKIGNVHLLS
jgi:pyruvate formate lyase activating enzyme